MTTPNNAPPRQLDKLDRLILNAIQTEFPAAPRPYQILAQRLSSPEESLTEELLWKRVQALRQDGFIRRLGAVFNAAPLGYRSVLCAASVPTEKIDYAAEIINAMPQITHNYLRTGDLNLWFTFSTDEPKELSDFLTDLKSRLGIERIEILEAEKRFKIKVDFRFAEGK